MGGVVVNCSGFGVGDWVLERVMWDSLEFCGCG